MALVPCLGLSFLAQTRKGRERVEKTVEKLPPWCVIDSSWSSREPRDPCVKQNFTGLKGVKKSSMNLEYRLLVHVCVLSQASFQ